MDITLGYLPVHEDGPSWYAWGTELPEEGSIPVHALIASTAKQKETK